MPRSALRMHMRYALIACAASLLTGVTVAAPASATTPATYGELARFGGKGKVAGKFELGENTYAFGVDIGEKDGVYVGDEPAAEGTYRLQKLSPTGEPLGSVEVKPACANPPCEAEDGIEGVVFDTVGGERRAYVLAGYRRGEHDKVDASTVAAGTLYAFSTVPKKEGGKEAKLVPASGTNEGVLATPATLKATSDTVGQALLEPKGIAIDPTTHEIIVAGQVDEGVGGIHLAVERITDTGEPGTRYVDPDAASLGLPEENSPVVTATGQVLLEGQNKIIEIPKSSSEAPKTVFELPEEESLVQFGNETGNETHGDGLAIAPEGQEGTLDAIAQIGPPEASASSPAVLELHYTTHGEEVEIKQIGWIGGRGAAGSGHQCEIGFEGEAQPVVAAASEGRAFVLEPGLGGEDLAVPNVIEFGHSAKPEGCPKAELRPPVVKDEEGQATSTVKLKENDTISSVLEDGDALSTEWNFGDGTAPETVTLEGLEETLVAHAFVKAGELKVKEVVQTDDLATPTLESEVSVTVLGPPTAEFEAPKEAKTGEAIVFNAEKSTDPNGAAGKPLKYSWKFGDGKEETTEAPTIKHTYETPGTYKVTLKITDKLGQSGTVTHEVTVTGGEHLQVTKNPSNKTVTEGSSATFEATASGSPTPTVQWEVSTDHGVEFKPLAGQASDTLTVTSVTLSESGYEYRAKFKAGTLEETTLAAKLTVEEKKQTGGNPGGGNPGGGNPGGSPPGETGVLPSVEASPDATLASTSLAVSKAGAVILKVTCPAGAATCSGTITLKTLGAVSARAAGAKKSGAKKSILTLASGTFAVPGGGAETVTLHLSAKARALLAKAHVLHARATIAAHNASGATHTAQLTITLRAAKAKH